MTQCEKINRINKLLSLIAKKNKATMGNAQKVAGWFAEIERLRIAREK